MLFYQISLLESIENFQILTYSLQFSNYKVLIWKQSEIMFLTIFKIVIILEHSNELWMDFFGVYLKYPVIKIFIAITFKLI